MKCSNTLLPNFLHHIVQLSLGQTGNSGATFYHLDIRRIRKCLSNSHAETIYMRLWHADWDVVSASYMNPLILVSQNFNQYRMHVFVWFSCQLKNVTHHSCKAYIGYPVKWAFTFIALHQIFASSTYRNLPELSRMENSKLIKMVFQGWHASVILSFYLLVGCVSWFPSEAKSFFPGKCSLITLNAFFMTSFWGR